MRGQVSHCSTRVEVLCKNGVAIRDLPLKTAKDTKDRCDNPITTIRVTWRRINGVKPSNENTHP